MAVVVVVVLPLRASEELGGSTCETSCDPLSSAIREASNACEILTVEIDRMTILLSFCKVKDLKVTK